MWCCTGCLRWWVTYGLAIQMEAIQQYLPVEVVRCVLHDF